MTSGHFWQGGAQPERLRPFFPKSRGKPRVDDRPVLSGIIYIKKNGLQWKDAPHRDKIRHILHGHFHPPLSGGFHEVPFSAPRGTNHQRRLDFPAARMLSCADLFEAYDVIRFNETDTMIHMAEFGYDGAVYGENTPHYADREALTPVP